MTAFAQSTLIATVRARGISSDDVSDVDMGTLITSAVNVYSSYRPNLILTTSATCLTTVADQPNYSKPDDALWVIEVAWHPDYSSSLSSLSDLYTEILLQDMPADDSSQLFIHYGQLAQLRRFFGGNWKMINDEIYLIPYPVTADDKVAVYYATAKALTDLDTVADQLFEDLVFYTAMQSIGNKKLLSGGWRAGNYSVDQRVGEQIVRHANENMGNVIIRLANSYTAQRS